jgi:hypothetical protein
VHEKARSDSPTGSRADRPRARRGACCPC